MTVTPIYPSISETEGVHLVKDFRTFMDFLFQEEAYLTKKSQQISPKFLYPLNQLMSYPTEGVTPKNKQEIYHELHLFLHLAQAAKLFEKTSGKNGNFNMVPNDRYEAFCSLTETEQYVTLLQILWTNVNWSKLSDRRGSIIMDSLPGIFNRIMKAKPGKKYIVKERVKSTNKGVEAIHLLDNFAVHFSYFGFWQVERNRNQEGRNYFYKQEFRVNSVKVTEFGIKMMQLLNQSLDVLDWNKTDEQFGGQFTNAISAVFESYSGDTANESHDSMQTDPAEKADNRMPFHEPFLSLFPAEELKNTLSEPENKWRAGTYIFKVTWMKGVWRRVALDAEHTLEDLHEIIQDAFLFDNDHLYAFFMDGRRFSDNRFNDPVTGEIPSAAEGEFGALDITIGQEILYLFDFGDEWTFKVKLEGVEPEGEVDIYLPGIVELRGEAPEQYRW